MEIGTIIFCVIIIVFILFIWNFYSSVEKDVLISDIIKEKLSELDNYKTTQYYIDKDFTKYIGIDEINSKVCLINTSGKEKENYIMNTYSFSDILEVEIIENGNSVSKMSKTSVAGRAILGGILLGGVGAVIGGFTANRNSFEKMNKISLKLIVNNTKNPIFEIDFYNDFTGKGLEKKNINYVEFINKANYWYGLFKVIIKKDDELIN